MSTWLDPVRVALDRRAEAVTFFFRDDDAGWEDDKLYHLLDLPLSSEIPIALAAIPMAIGSRLAAVLRSLVTAGAPVVSVHQHGFAHVNHETEGRKSEFGASRSRDLQRQDLTNGRRRLEDSIGVALPPLFTPPWNRCTRDTAECLAEVGVCILSRDSSAEPFGLHSLHELPVSLDWTGRRGVRRGPIAWGETIAHAIASASPVGVMLHHAAMTTGDRSMLRDLFDVLSDHPRATVRQMTDIASCARR